MNRPFLRCSTLCLLAAMLGACASAPAIRFHTLVAPASTTAPASPALLDRLDITSVIVPPGVDRQELVVRQGTAGLGLLENDRWSAPLADELRQALADSLTRSLGARNVSGLPSPVDADVLRIRVAVRNFELQAGTASLAADWTLERAARRELPALTCSSRLSSETGNNASAMVETQQKLVQTLASAMAAAARAQASGSTHCPD